MAVAASGSNLGNSQHAEDGRTGTMDSLMSVSSTGTLGQHPFDRQQAEAIGNSRSSTLEDFAPLEMPTRLSSRSRYPRTNTWGPEFSTGSADARGHGRVNTLEQLPELLQRDLCHPGDEAFAASAQNIRTDSCLSLSSTGSLGQLPWERQENGRTNTADSCFSIASASSLGQLPWDRQHAEDAEDNRRLPGA
eukprot:TRINITY_DN42020_c0_g1_i1.p1 TRINITY_DN42020_c0_g1~~TRINITY_DN42020_c0_g1_i1.p1  ORF type:complete len:192 (-),score=27.16 TRINITY_DN42020_c0_g1_i1:317-892(-)